MPTSCHCTIMLLHTHYYFVELHIVYYIVCKHISYHASIHTMQTYHATYPYHATIVSIHRARWTAGSFESYLSDPLQVMTRRCCAASPSHVMSAVRDAPLTDRSIPEIDRNRPLRAKVEGQGRDWDMVALIMVNGGLQNDLTG